jgi:dienelactone hydrolase
MARRGGVDGVAMALVLLAGPLVAGCTERDGPPPAGPLAGSWPTLGAPLADPLAPGPHTWTTEDYDLGETTVGGPDASHSDYEYEARLRGTLTMPDGPGPFPLAVFLHGQHSTCGDAEGGQPGLLEPCAAPYRNDRGYLYLMEHLASHGMAVASVLAHEVNQRNGGSEVGMRARGELVLATLDALAAGGHAPRLDLARVGLMGHSRGGEGVVTAAEVNTERARPYPLAGVIALAPTDFGGRNVTAIPFLSLAPYCDGDVYSLHGLRQFDQSRHTDAAAAKVQLLVMGANHNNYNTMWGSGVGRAPFVDGAGDDAGLGRHQNTHCDLARSEGGGRLSVEETLAEATLHLGGFLRWTVLGDGRLAPYFLGAPQPAEACPGRSACPGAVHVSAMTPGRRDLFHVGPGGPVGHGGAAVAVSAEEARPCRQADCAPNVYSGAWMLDVPLEPEATLAIDLGGPADLRGTPVLQVRVGVPTDRSVNAFGPPRMEATFADARGSVAVAVDHPALFMPPGLVADPGAGGLGVAYLGGAKVSANSVVIPVPDGIDAGNVTSIALRFVAAGDEGRSLPDRILVADAWLNRETSAALAPAAAP